MAVVANDHGAVLGPGLPVVKKSRAPARKSRTAEAAARFGYTPVSLASAAG